MNAGSRGTIGKGSDENLHLYRLKNSRKRLIQKLAMPLAVAVTVLFLLLMVLIFGFRVRSIEIIGISTYSVEDVLENSGVRVGDNILTLSSKDVEKAVKAALPFVKSVSVKKQYPSDLVLEVSEEYTTFCYGFEDEFFIFNRDMRLMDKYDSLDALFEVRNSIIVEMPLPKSSIVPQYIQMSEEDAYVYDVILSLSESQLVSYVSYLDLCDKFTIRLYCGKNVVVELGDTSNLESKFSTLLALLGENGSKMSGTVDLSCYPRCFYDLSEDYS